jgi:hypothetical protein
MKDWKYTGRSRRKPVAAFTTEPSDNSRAICNFCYDNGIEIKLTPYILNTSTGIPDNNFMQCSNCQAVISKKQMKHSSEITALGTVQYGGRAVFEPVVSRRRIKRDRNAFEPTEDPIPLLAGQPDKELEAMLKEHNAILLSVTDSGEDEEEDEH